MLKGPDRRKRRIWETRAWEHRRAWEESGLSHIAYARKAGLAPSTFSRWMRTLSMSERDGGAQRLPSESRTGPRQEREPQRLAARVAKSTGRRLLAVEVGALVKEEGEGDALAATMGRPVEIALPSGIRIRFPGGVEREELARFIVLLERAC